MRPAIPLLVLLTALSGCGRDEGAPFRSEAIEPVGINDRVVVLNADTLVVDGRYVRLANAFAPEQIPQARCWAEATAAKHATESVRDMVRAAREITVRPTGRTDADNRAISFVRLDGLDLGETLINEGLAAHDGEHRFNWCDPISVGQDRAPKVTTLFDLGR